MMRYFLIFFFNTKSHKTDRKLFVTGSCEIGRKEENIYTVPICSPARPALPFTSLPCVPASDILISVNYSMHTTLPPIVDKQEDIGTASVTSEKGVSYKDCYLDRKSTRLNSSHL